LPALDRGGATLERVTGPAPLQPAGRDRVLRRMRAVSWGAGLTAAGATAVLSAAAAHAFKGHTASTGHAARGTPVRGTPTPARVRVPRPQHVPAIAATPLAAPTQPPAAATPAPTPPPVQTPAATPAPVQTPAPVSGGS
jgi:hypothetical protein